MNFNPVYEVTKLFDDPEKMASQSQNITEEVLWFVQNPLAGESFGTLHGVYVVDDIEEI
jgi:hypothetical protein